MQANRRKFSRSENNPFTNWKTYAAAAGATLAMSTNADAGTIFYSGAIDITVTALGPNTNKQLPFAVSGHTKNFDIGISVDKGHAGTKRLGRASFYNTNAKVNPFRFAAQASGRINLAVKYLSGQAIHFTGGMDSATLRNQSKGVFGPGSVTGFVGFESVATGDFGWIKVKVSDSGDAGYPNEVQILGYAYDQTAGEAIQAGNTGTASAAPEPGTAALALLALGASGILAWRRRRSEPVV